VSDLKVTYFDFAGSRGEEVRLALVLAGVPFEDNRIPRGDFPALKPTLPFGSLPVLEVAGHGTFAQSNAILRLIGRLHGLYPEDPYEAARHDAVMEAGEECRQKVGATIHIADEAAKLAARRTLAETYLPQWARGVESLIGTGPFVAGAAPGVADVKLYMVHRWISTGTVDGIAPETFEPFAKLSGAAAAFAAHPAITGWYAKTR